MHDILNKCILKLILSLVKFLKKDIMEKYRLRFDKKLSYGEYTLFVYNSIGILIQ